MSSLTLVAISDIHNDYSMEIPDGDVFIFAGDISYIGEIKDLIRFNEWLGDLPHKHKLYIPGNHDIIFESSTPLAKEIVSNGTYLYGNKSININGKTFFGSPYTPTFGKWAFMMDEDARIHHWSTIPVVDVLVTHGPPKNILDANRAGEPCGCSWLAYEISNRIKPQAHIFGHIHEGFGSTVIGETSYYNVSHMNRDYSPTNGATIINI
ncbi:metallophosphatase domain-containing protein [bacterium]|nr:metallophosphatase domain-containing protein [bacterium]